MRKRRKHVGQESAIRAFIDRNRKQNLALQKLLNSLEQEFEANKKSITHANQKSTDDSG